MELHLWPVINAIIWGNIKACLFKAGSLQNVIFPFVLKGVGEGKVGGNNAPETLF